MSGRERGGKWIAKAGGETGKADGCWKHLVWREKRWVVGARVKSGGGSIEKRGGIESGSNRDEGRGLR